ncbi:hypothetical protein [Bacillus pumilus]|uniref:hypothetical protein n=1 Tax=Bacillus pumilus TaxID=1408 RepID=UPI0016425638|nr:hypothetical protein [Bacillus pumilus]
MQGNNIPDVKYSPPISDLFANFALNWHTLSPALWVLFGTLTGFYILKILKRVYGGE